MYIPRYWTSTVYTYVYVYLHGWFNIYFNVPVKVLDQFCTSLHDCFNIKDVVVIDMYLLAGSSDMR